MKTPCDGAKFECWDSNQDWGCAAPHDPDHEFHQPVPCAHCTEGHMHGGRCAVEYRADTHPEGLLDRLRSFCRITDRQAKPVSREDVRRTEVNKTASEPLTDEQVKNWRNLLATQLGVGPYAFLMPREEVQQLRDKFQQGVDEMS